MGHNRWGGGEMSAAIDRLLDKAIRKSAGLSTRNRLTSAASLVFFAMRFSDRFWKKVQMGERDAC